MKNIDIASILALAGLSSLTERFKPTLKEEKKCLKCGKKHRHNNAFCSAGCCSSWREQNPQQGSANHYHGEHGEVVRSNI